METYLKLGALVWEHKHRKGIFGELAKKGELAPPHSQFGPRTLISMNFQLV
jgi:hypothetical protein